MTLEHDFKMTAKIVIASVVLVLLLCLSVYLSLAATICVFSVAWRLMRAIDRCRRYPHRIQSDFVFAVIGATVTCGAFGILWAGRQLPQLTSATSWFVCVAFAVMIGALYLRIFVITREKPESFIATLDAGLVTMTGDRGNTLYMAIALFLSVALGLLDTYAERDLQGMLFLMLGTCLSGLMAIEITWLSVVASWKANGR